MTLHRLMSLAAAGAFVFAVASTAAAQTAPARSAASAKATKAWTPPRTGWGDPDLQGSYTNKDENGTPFERPADLAGKRHVGFGEKEMAALRKRARPGAGGRRPIGGSEEEDTGAGPPLVRALQREQRAAVARVRPADGKVPALDRGGAPARRRARQAARRRPRPADFDGPKMSASTTAASRAASPAR